MTACEFAAWSTLLRIARTSYALMRVTLPLVARILLPSPVQLADTLPVRRPFALISGLATGAGSKPNDGTAAFLVNCSSEIKACGFPPRVYEPQSMERYDMIFKILAVRERVVMKRFCLVREVR